ncbi:MAG: UrcA family protein [Pseudomonadales bacterium]
MNLPKRYLLQLSAGLLSLSLASISLPAFADGGYAITYSQAELSSQTGMENLRIRIEQAARNYCPTYLQIKSHRDVRTCVRGVMKDLVVKIGNESFTHHVATHSHKRPHTNSELALR